MKKVTSFLILLFFAVKALPQNYLQRLELNVKQATDFKQQLPAYEKWLPVAILTHHKEARSSLDSLKKLVNKNNSELGLGVYYLNEAYYNTDYYGDYDTGLELCLKAKDIFEQLDAKPQLVVAYNRLAFIVLWNEIAKKEAVYKGNIYENYLKKALEISRELKDRNLEILTLAFIGSYFNVTEKNNKKALEYFFEAEKMIKPDITPDLQMGCVASIAIIYANIGDEDKMLHYTAITEQKEFFEVSGYSRGNLYRAIAKMYQQRNGAGDLSRALQYAEKAYGISSGMNAPEFISQGAELLYSIHKQTGNEKEALLYLEKYQSTEDSLTRERFQKKYADYDIMKREATIKSLENDNLKQINRRNNVVRLSLIGLLVTGLFIAGFVYRNNRRLKGKNEELQGKNKEIQEALVKGQNIERKRMAADLHDNLGVQANAILHSTAVLKDTPNESGQIVENLHDTAKEMLVNLRETLWAMKNEDVSATELWIRVINFGKQLGNHYKQIHVNITGAAPANFIMESPRALHLLMIVQEAANNAVKHAAATQIDIHNELVQNSVWQISVTDNGKGFLPEAVNQKKDSYEMQNMQERAKAANASIEIKAAPASGTKILITVHFDNITQMEH